MKLVCKSCFYGRVQERAERIQSSLEELVKAVNERCKQYGLRAKPTSLVELPFGISMTLLTL